MTNDSSPMSPEALPSGLLVIALDGRSLPLRAMRIEATASVGLASVRVRQTFANAHAETLNVIYQLPLPADGLVSAFAFTVAGRRTEGRIEHRDLARSTYEAAKEDGQVAALLEHTSDSVFVQELCNLAPGAELEVEVVVD